MQNKKARQLRESWEDKPCSHPNFDKEYYLGSDTGDYICTTCGECFLRNEYKEIMEERKNKKG